MLLSAGIDPICGHIIGCGQIEVSPFKVKISTGE
jgi:hypothetical protein